MKSELEALEAKLSSLRQLLPDAARLTSLQNSVIPSSEEKQVGLEKQSSEEATQASTLHEEVRKLSQKEQVKMLPPRQSVKLSILCAKHDEQARGQGFATLSRIQAIDIYLCHIFAWQQFLSGRGNA